MCSSVEKMFALPRSCRCRLQNLLRTQNDTQFVVHRVSMHAYFCFKSSNALELFEAQHDFWFRNVLVQIQDPKGDDQDDALFFVDTGGVAN